MRRKSYNKSVFVNCPFDVPYRPLLQAAVFAVLRCGYYARSALEIVDSGQSRLTKIFMMIKECRFGIHDLSRTDLDHGYPRFNMPFELGLFLGAKYYGTEEQDRKSCLIFERVPFSYLRFISDIRGQDLRAHRGRARLVLVDVRNWLAASTSRRTLPGGAAMWEDYRRFRAWLPGKCATESLEQTELTWDDYWNLVSAWIEQSP